MLGGDGRGRAYVRLLGSIGRAVRGASLIRSQRVGTSVLLFGDGLKVDFLGVVISEAVNKAIGGADSAISRRSPDLSRGVQISVALLDLHTQRDGLVGADAGDLLHVRLFVGGRPVGEEAQTACCAPVLRAPGELLDEGLNVGVVVKVIAVDGGVAHQVRCFGCVAAGGGFSVQGRVMRLPGGCYACQVMEGVERCCVGGQGEATKKKVGAHIERADSLSGWELNDRLEEIRIGFSSDSANATYKLVDVEFRLSLVR